MKLWLLKAREDLPDTGNPWSPWYDKTFGFVIRAETEEEARKIAGEKGSMEKETIDRTTLKNINDDYIRLIERRKLTFINPWLFSEYSTCEELTVIGEEGVILTDYKRG